MEVRLKGRVLPIAPLRQNFVSLTLMTQRASGLGKAVQLIATAEGPLEPGNMTLTAFPVFHKSDFSLPISFDVSEARSLSVQIQTLDGRGWPSYSCRIDEGTCYTGQ